MWHFLKSIFSLSYLAGSYVISYMKRNEASELKITGRELGRLSKWSFNVNLQPKKQ